MPETTEVTFCVRGVASPLLANVYLHYVFDLWVHAWRQKHASGDVIVVRFADDIVVGFQVKSDAERFWAELAERFRKFHLEVHPEKTRLLEFGPYAAESRTKRGLGKPETFNFLGFTHICGKKRSNGRFTVRRQTIRKRLQARLSAVKTELRRRLHDPIPAVGTWPAPGYAQQCLHGSEETPEQQVRRRQAVAAARALNTIQANQPGSAEKRFFRHEDLAASPFALKQKGSVSSFNFAPGEDVLPGWELKLDVMEGGYWFMIRDKSDPCGFAYISNHIGTIYTAAPLR